MNRAGTALATGAVLASLLAVLGLAQWAARDRAEFAPGSAELVERAVRDAGLQVCSVVDEPDGLAPAALDSRAYEVAAGCPGDAATVVVDRFATAEGRDAAARRFESLVRPRGSGVVLTAGDGTVLVQGAGDGDVRARLVAALRGAGAR
ncbi:hypothetical protein [Geodermatophilus sp. SYSU D00815]